MWCETLIACCMLVNTILFGAEVQYQAKTLDSSTHAIFEAASHFFVVVFFAELVIRILFDGFEFFLMSKSPNRWHVTILIWVVMLSAVEFIMSLTGSAGGVGANLTYMRAIRMLKIIRLFRVIRFMRFSGRCACLSTMS